MVRIGRMLLKDASVGISKTLSEILVCPLSKQPLRLCEKTNSLISDSIGVSYPIVDGIPRLVPTDGKMIDLEEGSSTNSTVGSDDGKINHQRGSSS
ncbi:OLC1v1011104C1 [Oldenlandia corymbosa var. corymbosa]|uniref:Protein preY, mitochondrial n=1 Tax=Oldenlandia corymbosa var. corymbosa TaxID=529605 RepID=A0AAV1DT27_OLDCO|nr:OLC1v1011104C1 [Oldenlandia corymbosa var. corymbosa]